MTNNNPYDVLGLRRDATPDEIKQAYRRLAMKYHPDRNLGNPQAEAQFKAIKQAYEQLTGTAKPQIRAEAAGFVVDLDEVALSAADVDMLKSLCRLMGIPAAPPSYAVLAAVALLVAEEWMVLPVIKVDPPRFARKKRRNVDVSSFVRREVASSPLPPVLHLPLLGLPKRSDVLIGLCMLVGGQIPTHKHMNSAAVSALYVLGWMLEQEAEGCRVSHIFGQEFPLWNMLVDKLAVDSNPWQKLPPALRTPWRNPLLWARYGLKN